MITKFEKLDKQFVIAILWSVAAIFWISYTLIHYGADKGVLNLILGLIGGSIIGGIFGAYFSTTFSSKKSDQGLGITTSDTTIKTTTTNLEPPTDLPNN